MHPLASALHVKGDTEIPEKRATGMGRQDSAIMTVEACSKPPETERILTSGTDGEIGKIGVLVPQSHTGNRCEIIGCIMSIRDFLRGLDLAADGRTGTLRPLPVSLARLCHSGASWAEREPDRSTWHWGIVDERGCCLSGRGRARNVRRPGKTSWHSWPVPHSKTWHFQQVCHLGPTFCPYVSHHSAPNPIFQSRPEKRQVRPS